MTHQDEQKPTHSDNSNSGSAREFNQANAENAKDQEDLAMTAQDIEKLKQELADLKDRYMRSLAEMDNMRRRMEKDRSDTTKYALEGIMSDIIPILDSFDKALPQNEASDATLNGINQGFQMVHKQLMTTLSKHGLQAIPAKGVPFDPNLHQAIQRVEDPDSDAETVKDEYARGYTLNGRLVRPSMVSVSVPTKP